MSAGKAFIGVDVGTGSARAGVFDANGELLASARRPIRLWREPGDVVEHASDDIWDAVGATVKQAVEASGLPPEAFGGLGFDATCSLVVLDAAGRPLSVSPTGAPERDTIVWMDHRAAAETEEINAGGYEVLRYAGGRLSPEMQTPKLLWLKRHAPATFRAAAHFLDLTDFLSFRATGALERSLCTVTCKTTYLAHEARWDASYFRAIGLGELADEGFVRLGARIVPPGTALGAGLTAGAAATLGLPVGLPIGAGLIDAHAGALGTIGADGGAPADIERRFALILGTSSCCMALAGEPRFAPGVWGPYFGAVTPDRWLAEAGQSAFGAAIDRVVRRHPAFAALEREHGEAAFEALERDVVRRAGGLSEAALLARDLHVLPDFLGNRSPFADPASRAALVGLDLREDPDSLGDLYMATLVGLAGGLAQIVAVMERAGYDFDRVVVSGGAARSPLVRQVIADALDKPVSAPATSEPVLLGGAMLGAAASGAHDIASAMQAMSRLGEESRPAQGAVAAFHARRRRALARLQETERALRSAAEPSPAVAAWPKLVIFDCDGVLVDSEIIAQDITRSALAKLGVSVTPEDFRDRLLGQRFEALEQLVERRSGAPLPRDFRQTQMKAMAAALKRSLMAIPDVEEAALSLGARLCVASSSPLERVRLSLRVAGLDATFAADVFSGEDVARGKPAPDLFLHAAETLGVDPADCLVIEDSAAGVKAARAAGMDVLGFAGGSHFASQEQRAALTEAGASAVFRDMKQLPGLVAERRRARTEKAA